MNKLIYRGHELDERIWIRIQNDLSFKKMFDDCLDDLYQPERLNPEALEEGFFPPPWNFYEHPEKTKGWCEFQREMRKDPKYYLQGYFVFVSI